MFLVFNREVCICNHIYFMLILPAQFRTTSCPGHFPFGYYLLWFTIYQHNVVIVNLNFKLYLNRLLLPSCKTITISSSLLLRLRLYWAVWVAFLCFSMGFVFSRLFSFALRVENTANTCKMLQWTRGLKVSSYFYMRRLINTSNNVYSCCIFYGNLSVNQITIESALALITVYSNFQVNFHLWDTESWVNL